MKFFHWCSWFYFLSLLEVCFRNYKPLQLSIFEPDLVLSDGISACFSLTKIHDHFSSATVLETHWYLGLAATESTIKRALHQKALRFGRSLSSLSFLWAENACHSSFLDCILENLNAFQYLRKKCWCGGIALFESVFFNSGLKSFQNLNYDLAVVFILIMTLQKPNQTEVICLYASFRCRYRHRLFFRSLNSRSTILRYETRCICISSKNRQDHYIWLKYRLYILWQSFFLQGARPKLCLCHDRCFAVRLLRSLCQNPFHLVRFSGKLALFRRSTIALWPCGWWSPHSFLFLGFKVVPLSIAALIVVKNRLWKHNILRLRVEEEYLLLDVEETFFIIIFDGWLVFRFEDALVLSTFSTWQELLLCGIFLSPCNISRARLEAEETLEGLFWLFLDPHRFKMVKMMASEYVKIVSTCWCWSC